MEIKVGQIWEVTTDCFFTSGESNKYNRRINLKSGEKIEIRYPYEWHFRTEDSHYFHAARQMIIDNCILFGTIWEKVRWQNNAKLSEILRLRLYDKHQ